MTTTISSECTYAFYLYKKEDCLKTKNMPKLFKNT